MDDDDDDDDDAMIVRVVKKVLPIQQSECISAVHFHTTIYLEPVHTRVVCLPSTNKVSESITLCKVVTTAQITDTN